VDAHPDLAAEQRHLDHAYACLAAMREHATRTLAVGEAAARAEKTPDAMIVQWHLERRLAMLADTPAALCFGRLDEEVGDHFYIGRRHVEGVSGEPVVVDWRARVSSPFYRATYADAMGLARRRRFSVDGQVLVDIFDEYFDDPDAAGGGGLPDPLLAELERARTGQMRDIVATIQAEQDLVIRAPLEDLVIVQGGPGTGKTAVGLHRAAFLLYEHRELLERQRLLVIGPNQIFLRYIAQVLPSLGETAVMQATIESLMAGRYPVRATDQAAVAQLKGDARMSEVLRRAVHDRIDVPSDDVVVATDFGSVRLPAAEIATLVDIALARDLPSNDRRELFRERLVRLAWQRYEARPGADLGVQPAFVASLRAGRDFKTLVDGTWPSLRAPALVRSVLGNRRTLSRAADGVLDPDEQTLLLRRNAGRVADERWTRADLALLDEAEALTTGTPVTYGHVVVDEAQDLTAMELRLLARRTPERSMTVLGDLAQATAVGAQSNWDDALKHLLGRDARPLPGTLQASGRGRKARIEELAVGYRVPAAILDFANRLLPVAAPHVRPSRSVRTAGDPPLVLSLDAGDLAHAVATEVGALAQRWTTVGVIAPVSGLDDIAAAMSAAGIDFADARRQTLSESVTLLPPTSAKGLEFDAVVVVEPARIVAEEPSGVRVLYVALTRAVQHLGILHAEPLPELITAGSG
jgi:DNA helicase IV